MVGRLGVIIDVTLDIIPNYQVRRKVEHGNTKSFVTDMKKVQNDYNEFVRKDPNDAPHGIPASIAALDERQYFWHIPANSLMQMDFETLYDSTDLRSVPNAVFEYRNSNTVINNAQDFLAAIGRQQAQSFNSASQEELVQELRESLVETNSDEPAMIDIYVGDRMRRIGANNFSAVYNLVDQVLFPAGIFPAREAYINQNRVMYGMHRRMQIYDQYEVAIPLHKAGDCFEHLEALMFPEPGAPLDDQLAQGFPIPALIRFVKSEDFFLSPTQGEPRVYLNIEDYYTHSEAGENTGRTNTWFYRVMQELRGDICQGRLHWGKAGWNEHASSFDGAAEYPETWCHFGCFVKELDPENKFQGVSHVWRWDGLDYDRCCEPGEGFVSSPNCVCRALGA
ncbi:hypothetical protein CYMTET_47340 [Cymbomonas tetramitiformis]|uniref:D-arabinono-1,4-lactone oxidase C-terminal domain-containing protein n=1 Tax=Cymbomonas tetramitiformis TaxID=36881 RepID=A0AAE0EWS1_9CHLO|nr:hypothetical protein CYMTET_47340 [Cymbomonas tetramitiformis]